MAVEILRDHSHEALVAAVEALMGEQSRSMTRLLGGEVTEAPDLLMCLTGRPVAWGNAALSARLRRGTVDDRIEAFLASLRSLGVPGVWWVGPLSQPPDLGARLLAHGFVRQEEMPWMGASLSPLPPPPPIPDGLAIHRVSGPDMDAHWLRVMVEGFGLSDGVAALLSEAAATMGYGPEATWIRFGGLLDGRPVGSAGLRTGARVAGVYNVATPPDMRRRGIGAAMSFAAMRVAHDLGYEIALLGASTLGRGVYERLGFRDVCVVKEYAAPGSA